MATVPPVPPADNDSDDALDLGSHEFLDAGPSTSFVRKGPPAGKLPASTLPPDPADALADLPPVNPGEDWLESHVLRPAPHVPLRPTEPFDIAADGLIVDKTEVVMGESDVIGGLNKAPASGSNIFSAPLHGSSRFARPEEDTDNSVPVPELPADDLFAELREPPQPASALFSGDDDLPTVPAPDHAAIGALFGDAAKVAADSGPDYNQTDRGESGSDLFADVGSFAEVDLGGSGVNLLDPNRTEEINALDGPGSSIFGMPVDEIDQLSDDGGRVDVNEIPLMGSSDDKAEALMFTGDDVDGTSHIFQKGKGPPKDDAGGISFEMDDTRMRPDAEGMGHESARIDWSLPAGDDLQMSQRMTEDELEAAGVPDLRELSSGPRTPPTPPRGIPRKKSTEAEAKARPVPPPAAKSGSTLGWVGGGLAGALAGVGACAGAYFGGLLPNDTKPVVQTGPTGPIVAQMPTTGPSATGAPSLADAHALLAAGDPVRALKGFVAAGDDLPLDAKAGRGQARWLVRLRELAGTGAMAKPDDAELKLAEADLTAVIDGAENLKTNAEKQAGVKAALHLGLLKEVAGDPTAAAAIYSSAATKFPVSKPVFETALTRLRLTRPAAAKAALDPRQADLLAQTLGLTLVMLQADAIPAPANEAGFHFWTAVNAAATDDFPAALAAIAKARAAHDLRRLLLAGQGLNPLSDPLEQIFLRCCDDLTVAWTVRRDLYANPMIATKVKTDGVAGLAQMIGDISKKANDQAAAAEVKAKELADKATDAETKRKLAIDEREKAVAAELAAKKIAEDRLKLVDSAEAKALAAAEKEKAAGEVLAKVIADLKANKLADEKDDAKTIFAKLPDILKQAGAIAQSADVQKAAASLKAAKDEAALARAEATKQKELAYSREIQLALAAEKEKKFQADAEAKVKAANDKTAAEVAKAVEAADLANKARLDAATMAVRAAEAKVAEAKAAAAAEIARADADYIRKLEDARAGVAVPLTSGQSLAKEKAADEFSAGVELYFASRFADAEVAFLKATNTDPADARYYYFLGLARFAQGNPSATAAFKKGAELESRNRPNTRAVTASLERVQGPARAALSVYRP